MPTHTLLVGDNLPHMRHLLDAGAQFDVAYLDPPYNTGRADLGYTDRMADWTGWMRPRLHAVRDLLKPSGVCVLAIGPSQMAQAKLLADEVFGVQNMVAHVVWQGVTKGDATFTAGGLDHMFVHANDIAAHRGLGSWREPKPGASEVLAAGRRIHRRHPGDPVAAQAAWADWLQENRHRFDQGLLLFDRLDPTNGTPCDNGTPLDGTSGRLRYDVLHPLTGRPCRQPRRGWRWSWERMQAELASGNVLFGATEDVIPRQRRTLADAMDRVPPSTTTLRRARAAFHLGKVIGPDRFAYPKDHLELARWFSMMCPRGGSVLDPFAGSGSSGEAVAHLSSKGHPATWVGIELDPATAQEVCATRLRRVMTGQGWADGAHHKGLGGELEVRYA